MPNLVDSFLSSFMAAKQMQDQQRREEQAQIRASVEDAIKWATLQQNDSIRRDTLKANIDNRNALKADREADNLRFDAKEAENRRENAAKEGQAKDELALKKRGQAATNYRYGAKRKESMVMAEMPDSEISRQLTEVLSGKQSEVQQANVKTSAQNAVNPFLPQLLQAMAGGSMGMAGAMPFSGMTAPQAQPLQAAPTMEQVENEQSPEYLRQQANTQSLVDQRGAAAGLNRVKSKQLEALEAVNFAAEEAQVRAIVAQATNMEARTRMIPKEFEQKQYLAGERLNLEKIRTEANRLRAIVYQKTAGSGGGKSTNVQDAIAARQQAVRESVTFNQMARQLKDVYDKRKEAEDKAAEANSMNGHYIQQLQPFINNNPSEQMKADYAAAVASWNANNMPIPGTVTPQRPNGINRITQLSIDRQEAEKEWRDSLTAAGDMESIFKRPVSTAGKVATPAANSAIRRQFMNNKTKKLEWFSVKNGAWVKE